MEKSVLLEYRKKIQQLSDNEKILRELYLKKLASGQIYGPPTGLPSIDKPWLKYHLDSAITKQVPQKTLYRNLVDNSHEIMDNIALCYFDNQIKYRELISNIEETAKALQKCNLKKNDVITLLSITTPETVYLLYAANKLGITINLMDPTTNSSRIKYMVNKTNSKYVFALDLFKEKVLQTLENVDCNIITISVLESMALSQKMKIISKTIMNKIIKPEKDEKKSKIAKNLKTWKEFIKDGKTQKPTQEVPYDKEHIACYDYTGGSTGTPKGALLTDYAINALAVQYQNLDMDILAGQKMLNIMPMFLAYGINMLNMSLNVGITNIIIPKFNPIEFADLLKKYRFNHFMGVPAHFESLLDNPKLDNFDLSFWITPAAGGDLTNEGLEIKINEFLRQHNAKTDLIKGYGMTEMSSACVTCTNKVNSLNSTGIPLAKNTVGIFRPDSEEELSYDELGEVCITGPSMMKCYFENQEETTKVMKKHSDGTVWIHTGDLGYMNKDGFLYIKGRIKRVIIRPDGHNVFPSQIENAIAKHPAVKQVAVIKKKAENAENGFYPKAIIILHDQYKGSEEKIQKELEELCLEDLQERDVAYYYEFRSELPYNHAGKIDTIALEKEEEEKEKVYTRKLEK